MSEAGKLGEATWLLCPRPWLIHPRPEPGAMPALTEPPIDGPPRPAPRWPKVQDPLAATLCLLDSRYGGFNDYPGEPARRVGHGWPIGLTGIQNEAPKRSGV